MDMWFWDRDESLGLGQVATTVTAPSTSGSWVSDLFGGITQYFSGQQAADIAASQAAQQAAIASAAQSQSMTQSLLAQLQNKKTMTMIAVGGAVVLGALFLMRGKGRRR